MDVRGAYVIAWWQGTGSMAVALSRMPVSLVTSGARFVLAILVAPKLRKVIRMKKGSAGL